MFRSVRLVAAMGGAGLLAACGGSPATNPGPFRLASVFPSGPGREKVLNACGSCHSVACVTRGQRTAERWESVKAGHKDKMTDASGADLNEMFAYLAANFNQAKPEPPIPAELLQQGCTPF